MSKEQNTNGQYCWVAGCVKPWASSTSRIGVQMRLCNGHLGTLQRTGSLVIDIGTQERRPPEITKCQIPKCRNVPHTARLVDGKRVWVCGTHRTRYDKYGSFDAVHKPHGLKLG